MPKHPKKTKGKKTFMEKLKQRRRELDAGDARGGKRAPKQTKVKNVNNAKKRKRQFDSENG